MILKVRDLKLDTDSWDVTLRGEIVSLTYKEFKLLKRLMEEPNVVISGEKILSEWEAEKEYSLKSNIVVVFINYLNKKIPDYIFNVRKAGYKIK